MDNEDEEEEACPLCMQPLDETDLSFFACPCNYQVCLFCVHYIMEQMNGKCPACRTEYVEASFRYDATRAQQYRERAAAKKKGSGDRDKGSQKRDEKSHEEQERDLRARHAEQLKQRKGRGGRRDLSEVRVVQRNVVHVIGLTANIAKAEVLRRPEFFGQYGKLSRVTVSKAPTQAKFAGNSHGTPVYSAYLTFDKPDEAHVAIQAVDGFAVDGQMLRASFGTTKYCRKFLEGEKCERKDCNFLHKLVDENGYDKGSGKGNKEGRGREAKDAAREQRETREREPKEREAGGRERDKDRRSERDRHDSGTGAAAEPSKEKRADRERHDSGAQDRRPERERHDETGKVKASANHAAGSGAAAKEADEVSGSQALAKAMKEIDKDKRPDRKSVV